MKIQNIIKSISAVIGLLAALFLIRIILMILDQVFPIAAQLIEQGMRNLNTIIMAGLFDQNLRDTKHLIKL